MNWKQNYEKWLNFENLDSELKAELDANKGDENFLQEAFHKNLEFGTAGMRGEIGVGTNRLNVYTVRKATKGLAKMIADAGDEAKKRGVVVAYDSRHKSPEFGLEVAKVLGRFGITTYLFESLRATPVLSFAVRHLNAYSGIVLTASHNPPEYNGYKVYGEDGAQLPPKEADDLIGYVNAVENELEIEIVDAEALKANGLLKMIGKEVDDAYLEKLQTNHLQPELIKNHGHELKIVFTPLHGTAYVTLEDAFAKIGFTNVTPVKEQIKPDPNFSTVPSPNPEEHDAFEYAIKYGEDAGADILLATDPDADRLGIAVKNEAGVYQVLTGNQTGALMLHYLLSTKKDLGILPANGAFLKTIVTTELGRKIAESFGMTTFDVLTGFKFIGEKIKQWEQTNEHTYQFGYEESYGYLVGDFVRDKDAVGATLFACEMTLHYKKQGKSLYEALMDIFAEYGYYYEDLLSITMKGIEGTEKISALMQQFRQEPPLSVAGLNVVAIEDYKAQKRFNVETKTTEPITLPPANVLKYYLDGDAWVAARPSGTEPKIKFYFAAVSESWEESVQIVEQLKAEITKMLED